LHPAQHVRLLAIVGLLALGILSACSNPSGAASTSAPTAGALAPAPDLAGHATIDGIPCGATEVVSYHVHAHVAIFVNGQPRGLPEGLGIAAPRHVDRSTPSDPFVDGGACFYWLHTHTNDGVIHIEGPAPMAFTLKQLFDIWQQPLSLSQVGTAQGKVFAYLEGVPFPGDPGSIPLAAHAVIQLNVGQDVAPRSYTFDPGL
jgi:hypothetical protein